MIERAARRIALRITWRTVLGSAALAILTPSCATRGVKSGAAVGQLGQGLAMHSDSVPQGAEACAMQEALAPATGGVEKPVSETCGKALNKNYCFDERLSYSRPTEEAGGAFVGGESRSLGRARSGPDRRARRQRD